MRRKFHKWPATIKPRSIKTLIECYEDGLAGAYDDPEADEKFHDFVGKHSRADVVCGDYNLMESGKGKLTLLTPAIEQLLPGAYPGPAQEVGDCVSHSGKNATLLTLCSAVLYGDALSGVPKLSDEGIKNGAISTCWRYWFRGHGGHGWHCSSEITVAMREGTMLCKEYPEIDLDLTRYSGRLASRYGRSAPPEEYSRVGREHLVKTATQVRSFEECRDLIANGYGISSCGGEGFSSTRDENGVSQQRGSWAHAMAYAGVDDRPWAHETYGGPLVLVLNSWGSRWISGPRRVHGTNLMIPHGSFWAKWSDIRRRSMFAVSAINGWPPQKLPDYGATLI